MNAYNFFKRKTVTVATFGSVFLILMNHTPLVIAADRVSNPFAQESDSPHSQPQLQDLNTILHPETLQHSENADEPNVFLYTFPHNTEPSAIINTAKAISEAEEPLSDQEPTILINFNNVNITEYIRFVSRVTNKNFIFDDTELDFHVTIISEQPATIDNVITALVQELRIHGFSLLQDGNELVIHKNDKEKGLARVAARTISSSLDSNSALVTRVFLLNTLNPEKAAALLRPMSSSQAIIEALPGSNYLVITDLTSNVDKISQLLKSVDAPNSGVVIGQYQSAFTPIETMLPVVEQIMFPISQNQTLVFVPYAANNSVYVVASPFLVARSIAILKHIEEENGKTGILDLSSLDQDAEDAMNGGRPTVVRMPYGDWTQNDASNWMFKPMQSTLTSIPPKGRWHREYDGAWQFISGETAPPGAPSPNGRWVKDKDGFWIFELTNETSIGRGPGIKAPGQVNPNEVYIDKTGGRGNTEWSPNELIPKDSTVVRMPTGEWIENEARQWGFKPNKQGGDRFNPPQGRWDREYDGSWQFHPGEVPDLNAPNPKGRWVRNQDGYWVFQLYEDEAFDPGSLTRHHAGTGVKVIPGAAKVNKFMIEKLKYRRGDSVEPVLRKIADTIQQNERGNEDLIAALRSIQWLNTNNSLVFSGTVDALDKARALIKEIDQPMRQVFIEMLILETTLRDALNFGVSYATRFADDVWSGSQGFLGGPEGNRLNPGIIADPPLGSTFAIPAQNSEGFDLGIIGKSITLCGQQFGSIGALVHALHGRTKNKIISNPKLLIEDGAQAELFVGSNTPYRTQAIANDNGDIITANFEYRDVGTLLKITPYIGNGNIISLAIQEEVSVIINGFSPGSISNNSSPGPTTQLHRTVTRVHIPDCYFLIISGMMDNQEVEVRTQVPCLGGAPLLGGLFSNKTDNETKRNLMIFMRPHVIDTEEEIQRLTKREQDIYDYNNTFEDSNRREVEELLDLMNLDQVLNPETRYYDPDKLN